MKTETEYEPYSEPWVKEMMKIKKCHLVTLYKDLAIKKESLLQERDTLKNQLAFEKNALKKALEEWGKCEKDVEFLCGKINEIEKEHRENSHGRLKVEEANKELIEVLTKIANWELPHTGQFWDDGTPISFEANQGSNGVRDYMKSLAEAALLKHRKGE